MALLQSKGYDAQVGTDGKIWIGYGETHNLKALPLTAPVVDDLSSMHTVWGLRETHEQHAQPHMRILVRHAHEDVQTPTTG